MTAASAPLRQVVFMCFMMWMMGNGIQIFSIIMTLSGLATPIMAIVNSGKGTLGLLMLLQLLPVGIEECERTRKHNAQMLKHSLYCCPRAGYVNPMIMQLVALHTPSGVVLMLTVACCHLVSLLLLQLSPLILIASWTPSPPGCCSVLSTWGSSYSVCTSSTPWGCCPHTHQTGCQQWQHPRAWSTRMGLCRTGRGSRGVELDEWCCPVAVI